MANGFRLAAGVCAAALTLAAPMVVGAAPGAAAPLPARGVPATSTSGPPSFVQALAAIPEATKARAAARVQLRQAQARQAIVRATAMAARGQLESATATARESAMALARADVAAASTQEAMDDAARIMYASGGNLPMIVDVMLTADSEAGFTRSLVTREYVASVGSRMVQEHVRAGAARSQAATAAATALAQRDAAATVAGDADETLAAATRDVATEQTAVDRARGRYKQLMRLTRVDRSEDYGRLKTCGDWLTKLLSRSGFEGEDLREAWAIVMRESGGREDAVSATKDLGLFQINTATWRDQDWFDRKMLLTRKYNSQIAHELSRGGRSWYSWGLDGHGRPNAGAYVKSGWSPERIESHIVMPYVQWYAQYPCRPAYETDAADMVPTLPPRSEEDPALFMGGGSLAGQ